MARPVTLVTGQWGDMPPAEPAAKTGPSVIDDFPHAHRSDVLSNDCHRVTH